MSGANFPRPPVHNISFAQLLMLGASTALLSRWAEPGLLYSWVSGGLVAIVPQACFNWHFFCRRGAPGADRIVARGYLAEAGKLGLAALGFALIFALLRPLSVGAVFAAWGGMLIIQLVGSWYLLR